MCMSCAAELIAQSLFFLMAPCEFQRPGAKAPQPGQYTTLVVERKERGRRGVDDSRNLKHIGPISSIIYTEQVSLVRYKGGDEDIIVNHLWCKRKLNNNHIIISWIWNRLGASRKFLLGVSPGIRIRGELGMKSSIDMSSWGLEQVGLIQHLSVWPFYMVFLT